MEDIILLGWKKCFLSIAVLLYVYYTQAQKRVQNKDTITGIENEVISTLEIY